MLSLANQLLVPLGTIIHPSVYCLLHRNVALVMDSHNGGLIQQLLEKAI